MFISVDGNYTEWTAWTACDKTCGAGLMTRWRACANPKPQYGGRDCSMYGQDTETKSCQIKDYCPSKSLGYYSFFYISSSKDNCRFSLIVRVSVVLNRTVDVDSD